jgi:hypothetical protein
MAEDFNWWQSVPPPPRQYLDVEHPPEGAARRIAEGWTLALCDRREQITAAAREVPFFSYSAVGLLDRETDQGLRQGDRLFGVILYAEGEQLLQGDGQRHEPVAILSGDERTQVTFPIVVRRGVFSSASSSKPASSGQSTSFVGGPNGTLACWSRWHGTQHGWLTARHCAASLGTVVAKASDCIDAALVDIGKPAPYPTKQWPVSSASPSAGLAVDLHIGTGVPTAVVNVSDTLGTKDSKFPLRFSTRHHGSPGDSGSIITENSRPFGLYLGKFWPVGAAKGDFRGYGLALSQLEKLVKMEVFQ